MRDEEIIEINRNYWDEHADLWHRMDNRYAKTRKAKMLPLSFCLKAREI